MSPSEENRLVAEQVRRAAAAQVSFRDLVRSRPRNTRNLFVDESQFSNIQPEPVVLKVPDEDDLDAAGETIASENHGGVLFAAAVETLSRGITLRPETARILVSLLSDEGLSNADRIVVINALQQMSFSAAAFAPSRPAYLQSLRGLVRDRSVEIRRRALGVLTRQKDDFAQRELLAGLEGDAKPLVPAADAIRLLSNDIHAEYIPLLRRLALEAPTRAARIEAVDALAGDPSSADLLFGILDNANEDIRVRKACAAVLPAIAPQRAAQHARRIVMAEDEDDQLRAVSLTNLTHAEAASETQDTDLQGKAMQLHKGSRSRALRRASTNYLDRHGS